MYEQACTIYVITGAAAAPPRALKTTLRNRTARAAMRTFGMEALAALLRTLAPEGRAQLWTGAPSAVQVRQRYYMIDDVLVVSLVSWSIYRTVS